VNPAWTLLCGGAPRLEVETFVLALSRFMHPRAVGALSNALLCRGLLLENATADLSTLTAQNMRVRKLLKPRRGQRKYSRDTFSETLSVRQEQEALWLTGNGYGDG
jgi:hypothetical protein